MFTVKPIDDELLEKAAKDTGLLVSVEEHNIFGGLGGAVDESVSSRYPIAPGCIWTKSYKGSKKGRWGSEEEEVKSG